MSNEKIEKPNINNGGAAAADPDRGELSSKRVAANHEKPQRSTGPRTVEGKAISSQNATRHGFFSRDALIPGESPEEFEAFRNDHWAKLRPQGGLEDLLAEQFIITSWRLLRLERIEAEGFRRYGLSKEGEVMGAGYSMIATIQGDGFLCSVGRYEAHLRRQYFRCLDTMHGLRKSGQFPHVPPPILLEAEEVPPNPESSATDGDSRNPATVEGDGGDPAPAENPDPVTKVLFS